MHRQISAGPLQAAFRCSRRLWVQVSGCNFQYSNRVSSQQSRNFLFGENSALCRFFRKIPHKFNVVPVRHHHSVKWPIRTEKNPADSQAVHRLSQIGAEIGIISLGLGLPARKIGRRVGPGAPISRRTFCHPRPRCAKMTVKSGESIKTSSKYFFSHLPPLPGCPWLSSH